MYNVVNTIAPSVLIECSSFLQITSITIRFQMRVKLCKTRPWTAALAALERLNFFTYIRTIYNIL